MNWEEFKKMVERLIAIMRGQTEARKALTEDERNDIRDISTKFSKSESLSEEEKERYKTIVKKWKENSPDNDSIQSFPDSIPDN